MLVARTLNVSHFDDFNIIDFFKRFSNLCNKYRIINAYKIIKLFRYCDKFIKDFVKSSSY